MKTKAIFLTAVLVTLAIFAQGWRNGQQSQGGNPTAQNCANSGCHGGPLEGASVCLTAISGNNQTWTQGTNALVIQPIAATDTFGGGFSGDSTFKFWGYTMNFTSCTGGPLPLSVSLHNCSAGTSLRYTSNGVWYVEGTGNIPLTWQQISGKPANVSYLTSYCMIVFTNGDSLRTGDSTIFYSTKLGYEYPFATSPQTDVLSVPKNTYVNILTPTDYGVYIHHRGAWCISTVYGRRIAVGYAEREVSLKPGMYIIQTDNEKPIKYLKL